MRGKLQPLCEMSQPLCGLCRRHVDCHNLCVVYCKHYRAVKGAYPDAHATYGLLQPLWGLPQATCGLFQALGGLHRHYVGFCNLCADCCSLCVGYTGTMYDVVTSVWTVAASVWDVQVLCGLLSSAWGTFQVPCGFLQPLH